MALPILRRRSSAAKHIDKDLVVGHAAKVVRDPRLMGDVPEQLRPHVNDLVKAMQAGASWTRPRTIAEMGSAKPVSAQAIAQRAAASLQPSSSITPVDIELALHAQGLDWVQPFAPGEPLVPYYGYGRRPRQYDYRVGRNITTETRPDRIPFHTLKQLYDSYDVAQICTRHAINGLRSMRIRLEPMDGYEGNPVKEMAAARKFLHRIDGRRTFRNFVAQNMLDLWRYDAAPIFRQRDRAGHVVALKNVNGPTIAPMLDYFGDIPEGDAPAFQQFIQGIPWDWLKISDIIYEPFWPETESPYGTPPLETVLINANTDIRLQMYFLDFFTKGTVPEAFAIAPEDQSDPDSLAELQETWNDYAYGDQAERWGLRWLPNGTEIENYKPQQFDPNIAEYVMRRTVAAFLQVPHDLGFTDNVNKASGDTQMDVQFRINDLPTCGYYEDIFDSVLQDDLGLPVQIRFDTGREKEDRLMEAQAHQIYVSIGAENPDEVREKVLGHAVNPEEKIPRFFDSVRLGPVPIAYLLSVAGEVDPRTGAPLPGTVKPQPYVPPSALMGVGNSDPNAPKPGPGQAAPGKPTPGSVGANRANAARAGSGAKPAAKGAPGLFPTQMADDEVDELAPTSAHPAEDDGYGWGVANMGSTGQGTGVKSAEDADLARWRSNARKAVDRGRAPRRFVDCAISGDIAERVWKSLEGATTREEVDAAFAKAALPKVLRPGPGGHREEELVAYWAPRVLAALRAQASGAQIAERFAGLTGLAKAPATRQAPRSGAPGAGTPAPAPPVPLALPPAAAAAAGVAGAGAAAGAAGVVGLGLGAGMAGVLAATVTVSAHALVEALVAMWAASWIAGAKDGHDQLADHGIPQPDDALAHSVEGTDWEHWTPAHAPEHAPGFQQVRAERGELIAELEHTTREQIVRAVHEFVAGRVAHVPWSNADVAELARRIDAILGDEKRAMLIARTEVNRAMTQGALALYQRAGIPMFDLVTHPGACPICVAIREANPHPLSDGSAQPPIHPNCRCSAAPVTGS